MEDKFVLISSDKQKFIISQIEFDLIFGALEDGAKYIRLQKSLLPLNMAPTIIPFARWYAQELERLVLTGKRLCRKCLKIMTITDKCDCWQATGKGKSQDAFLAPKEQMSGIVSDFAKKMSFPELTEADRAAIALENANTEEPTEYIERGGSDGYIDPESGEEHFS